MTSTAKPNRYLFWLSIGFAVYWAAWAIKPKYFVNWVVESTLLVVAVLVLFFTRKRFPLSNVSYTLIAIFLALHTVGSHYSYSEVPYNRWLSNLIGWSFQEGRNHYDRLVHFSFGLFLAYPIRELFLRIARVRGFWGYYLPLDLTMSFSMLYELIEWGYAEIAGGEAGASFLGSQGDQWDAQKDMALASLGALIAMIVVGWINWKFDKNFGAEFKKSLQPAPGDQPLGENRLNELRQAAEQGTASS